MIVSIQYKANVFDRNQQEQGPEDERHGTQNIIPRDRHQTGCMDPKENLQEGVEDGGPNIPIDNPAGPHDEQSKTNTHRSACVCRMLDRCSTNLGIKRPHRSSFQKEEKQRPAGALLVQMALAQCAAAVSAVHNTWTRGLPYREGHPPGV